MRLPKAILLFSFLSVFASSIVAQEPEKTLPKVTQHAEPVYPPLARQARIQGEVQVRFTTNGDSVVSAEAVTGHPLLMKAAEDNVRTWKFVAHDPGTFIVSFRYGFLPENGEVAFLQSPAVVELREPVPIIQDGNYASIDLGRWKAQLKSARGKSQQVFDLYESGPDGEWLEGRAIGAQGQDEEIDIGYVKEGLLGFTVIIGRPGGKRVKVFFIGKITDKKIKGTFVDDSGTTGEWTAVRVGNSIPPQ